MRNLKRALSLALASVMLMGMMVVGTGAKDFADAGKIKNVEAASVTTALGIFEGDGDNFAPARVVTRAEMAVLLCRMMQLPEGLVDSFAGTKAFTDVDTNNWSTGAIAIAAQKGWIEGDGYIKADGMANFYPTNTVTTAEAALMIQRAIGYWAAKDESVNDLADANILAYELLMMEGLTLSANAGLTRDNVAGIIYNTLMNSVNVYYDMDKGYLTTYGDLTATPANIKRVVDTGESLFDGFGLTEVGSYTDAQGRPMTAWVNDDNEVVTFTTEKADVIYTEATEADDIADDVKGHEGVDADAVSDYLADPNTVVEIFFGIGYDIIDGKAYEVKIATPVMYTYAAGKVTDVDTDKDGVTTVTVDGEEYITSSEVDFAEDDIVVYTGIPAGTKNPADGKVYEGDIASIALAKLVGGEVTAISVDNYIRLDGVKYEVATTDISIGDAGAVAIDPNGNEIAFFADVEVEAEAAYAYVTDIRNSEDVATGSDVGYADMILADGSKVTVALDMDEDNIYNVEDKLSDYGVIYTYEVKDGKYILTEIDNVATTADIDNGSRVIVGDETIHVDFDTIFVDKAAGVAYTGIEAVPSYDAADVVAAYDEGVAAIVFITDGASAEETETYVYITNADAEITKKGDTTLYTYEAIVDGAEGTVTSTKDNKFTATGLFTIDTVNADGYTTEATPAAGVAYDAVEAVTAKAIYVDANDYATYDSKTIFIVVEDGEASIGAASDIVAAEDLSDKDLESCGVEMIVSDNYASIVVVTITNAE